jgi:hypothetical protein
MSFEGLLGEDPLALRVCDCLTKDSAAAACRSCSHRTLLSSRNCSMWLSMSRQRLDPFRNRAFPTSDFPYFLCESTKPFPVWVRKCIGRRPKHLHSTKISDLMILGKCRASCTWRLSWLDPCYVQLLFWYVWHPRGGTRKMSSHHPTP